MCRVEIKRSDGLWLDVDTRRSQRSVAFNGHAPQVSGCPLVEDDVMRRSIESTAQSGHELG
jgi:hypothetical protein